MSDALSLSDVARRTGVSPQTLRRWQREGLLPAVDGEWTTASATQARIVARMRERGHSLAEIRRAAQSGRLAYGYVQELFAEPRDGMSLDEAAEAADLEPAMVARVFSSMGLPATALDDLTDEDVQFLRYAGAVLSAGFPLVAFVQLVRVYGQALSQISDAEVRLFHLYVHEPLMRDGVPEIEMAEEMQGLARELLPLASPIMDYVHQRLLGHYIEQDVVGHMESELDEAADLGRLRVAIAFADLAGYTRMTEEQGDEEAVVAVERFVSAVEATLPDDARIIKTVGDEVMLVGSDAAAMTDWAVGFQELYEYRPLPRIGLHCGEAIYREGDYFGREVNLAARVAARAAGGEVLVTRPVVEASGPYLEFDLIGEVRLKGFTEATELFLARLADE